MGNQCTSNTHVAGGDVPYYDIKLRGCYSDPYDYFKLQVSTEAKRRYALDHIRFTIAQRRKDSAFQRSLGPPPIPLDAVKFVNESGATPSRDSNKSISDMLAAFTESASNANLADPLHPYLLDKSRVVAELEEVTHERVVAALLRAKTAIEASFVTPMEALVEEAIVQHDYVRNAVPEKGALHNTTDPQTSSEEKQPPTEASAAATSKAAAPSQVPARPPKVSCIPWQVSRLSWLTTLELVTLDTGDQVVPQRKKAGTVTKGEEANYNNNHIEYDEFSMLKNDNTKAPKAATSAQNTDHPALTPSCTVEVAFAEFPVDKSMRRAIKWNKERKRAIDRFVQQEKQFAAQKRRGSKDNKVDDDNKKIQEEKVETNANIISSQAAQALARLLVDHQRIIALFGLIATRSLIGPDHPMFTSLWSNPSVPAVAAEIASRYPQLTLARERPLPGIGSALSGTSNSDEQRLYGHAEGNNSSGRLNEELEIVTAVAEWRELLLGNGQQYYTTNKAFQSDLLNQLQRNINNVDPISPQPEEGLFGNDSMIGAGPSPAPTTASTNRNAAPASAANSKPQKASMGTTSHSPACMCQTCVEKLWEDIDLRHLVNWPPTACVARPTVSVLSHNTSIEAVVVVPKTKTETANDAREGPDPPRPGQGSYEEMAEVEDNNFEFYDISNEAQGANNTIPRNDIKFVRRHKATVLVLFYHHRLRTSNVIQRRLLAEDTSSIPLLQPEASASSSMLLRRSTNDSNHLLARKARLQMLSNYRDLKSQQTDGEAIRRKLVSDGVMPSGGGRDGNGAATLPTRLASMAASLSAGECSLEKREAANIHSSLHEKRAAMRSHQVKGATHHTDAGHSLANEANDVEMSQYGSPPRPGADGDMRSPQRQRTEPIPKVLAICTAALPNGTAPPPATGIDIELSSVAKGPHHFPPATTTVTAFAKSDLPHFPPHGLLFATTKNSNERSEAGNDMTLPIGPALRAAAARQPCRLDAVDLVVEALCIDLEAYELLDDAQTEIKNQGSEAGVSSAKGGEASILASLMAQYQGGGQDLRQAPLVMGLDHKHEGLDRRNPYAAPEVSLLSTLAPAVDLRKASQGDMPRLAQAEKLGGAGSDATNSHSSGLTFKEPPKQIVSQAAAEGAVNKNAMRAERRKEVDKDDIVSGALNAPQSKASEGSEGVRTNLALRMMAAHYQAKLEEQRSGGSMPLTSSSAQQQLLHLQHDMSQFQSYLAQVAFQVQTEIWMKDLFPL